MDKFDEEVRSLTEQLAANDKPDGLAYLADNLGTYYKALIAAGLPGDTAQTLVEEFHSCLMGNFGWYQVTEGDG